MSYDNAEPKVLKTLNSSGQVLDDGGNVINDTTSYWEKKYNEAEPKPDKILKSDGSVVDSNGNQIQATNEYNVKKYNQAEPIPAKYLHADGTIDENPGSGGADLEDNKTATIDVSTYTEPVEITPTQGKDGMKKATVTLSNIPQIQSNKAQTIDVSQYTEPVEIEPTSPNDAMTKVTVTLSNIPKAKLYAWGPAGSQGRQYFGYTLSPTPNAGDVFFYILSTSPHCIKKDSEYGIDSYNPSTDVVMWSGLQHPRNSQYDIDIL